MPSFGSLPCRIVSGAFEKSLKTMHYDVPICIMSQHVSDAAELNIVTSAAVVEPVGGKAACSSEAGRRTNVG